MRWAAPLLLFMIGCGSLDLSEPDQFAKVAAPFNVGLSWFGNVALHEAGHTIAADLTGAHSISVDLLPTRDPEGNSHLGLTTAHYYGTISDAEKLFFDLSGPATTLLTHIIFGELNRSGLVPRHLQPTVGWLDFGSMASTYTHSILGLARSEQTDLGKHDAWIAGAFLVVQLTYDIVRIGFSDGGFEKYFKVMFGQDFYGE